MIPLEKPANGGSSSAAASGSGAAGPAASAPRRPAPAQARGLLREIRAEVRTAPFQDGYRLSAGRELGRGKFAVVRKCIKKDSGKEFAAKFMRKRRKGQDCRMEIIHEIAVLELAQDSPWVINLHEVYETPSEMILVLEYAAGGEIFDQCIADREDAFKEKDVQRLMRQILEGVHFLHTHDVVHLDLKPQNILLTSESPLGDIKIVDFGLSRIMKKSEELREIMGTPEYVAPEILSYDPISMATDMWSIGVLTYVMLTGVSPFLGDNKQETFLNISQMNLSYSEEEFDGVSESAIDFIKRLLLKKPEDRATAEECLRHPWLTPSSVPSPFKVKGAVEEADALPEAGSGAEVSGDPEATLATEELIVVTSYTLGQCRQSVFFAQTENSEEPLWSPVASVFLLLPVAPRRTASVKMFRAAYFSFIFGMQVTRTGSNKALSCWRSESQTGEGGAAGRPEPRLGRWKRLVRPRPARPKARTAESGLPPSLMEACGPLLCPPASRSPPLCFAQLSVRRRGHRSPQTAGACASVESEGPAPGKPSPAPLQPLQPFLPSPQTTGVLGALVQTVLQAKVTIFSDDDMHYLRCESADGSQWLSHGEYWTNQK